MDNHGDDIAAARGGTGTENDADGDTIEQTGHHGVEEHVGQEPHLGTVTHERKGGVDRRVHKLAVMDERRIAPGGFHDIGEHGYQHHRDDGLQSELGSQDDGTDNQQRNIHADTRQGYLPTPQGIKHVGQAIHAARSQVVRVDKHHVGHGKHGAAQNEQQIGHGLFFPVFFNLYFIHKVLIINK